MERHSLRRKAHFLGGKIRSLRKRHRLTLEDLSVRCVQIDAEHAPSVSYLSMIENGKRVPSEELLTMIAEIFQKELAWFYDETLDEEAMPESENTPVADMPLEPGFLFTESLLKRALPEFMAQTGVTGRQFAHLLIRAQQETRQNRFPDLERAAETVGHKQFPLYEEDIFGICRRLGIQIRWFERGTEPDQGAADQPLNMLVRSFFDAPRTIYINKALQQNPARLKYDLANHIAHVVLHDGDGARATQVSGGRVTGRRHEADSPTMDAKDVLYAWRDFECSYFAAALLAPKVPFRQYLAKNAYAINVGEPVGLTTTLVMRRMSSVSPYRHWHYFDAYPPGNLRAVYRGNGIPLPWGNMRLVSDPCQHWAVFRMLGTTDTTPSAQISVLINGDNHHLYCCESIRSTDAANNPHVLCAGIDLAPALRAQGSDADALIAELAVHCNRGGGSAPIPPAIQKTLNSISKILNIGWIAAGGRKPATIICPRSQSCPRQTPCQSQKPQSSPPDLDSVRASIMSTVNESTM